MIAFTNLVNTFNESIVFLTFFCCHESAVLSTDTKTDEMRPNYSARPFRSFLFLKDAFTKELKISIACSRWWFDRLITAFLSGELSAPLISLSTPSLFSLSRSLEAGRAYRRSGFSGTTAPGTPECPNRVVFYLMLQNPVRILGF